MLYHALTPAPDQLLYCEPTGKYYPDFAKKTKAYATM